MAGLMAFAKALREADDAIRARGGLDRGLKALVAWLLGVVFIRCAANSYIILVPLGALASLADLTAVACLAAAIACVPMFAASALATGTRGLGRRLDLLPMAARTRPLLDALAPALTRLPATAAACLLPAAAAFPLTRISPAAWAAASLSSALIAASAGSALASLSSLAGRLSGAKPAANLPSAREGAYAALLGIFALSNPTAAYKAGTTSLTVFLAPVDPPAFATGLASAGAPPLAAACALVAALLAAAEGEARRRAARSSSGRPARGARRSTAAKPSGAARPAARPALAIIKAADAAGGKRTLGALALSSALAALSVAQDAKAAIPAAAAAALAAAGLGKAFSAAALDSELSRRLSFVPARPGRAESVLLAASALLALLTAAPLAAAALTLGR